ncbi:MAG: acyltransferase [Treponema sp.]|nr:acyltransferase [Treponema sp.]
METQIAEKQSFQISEEDSKRITSLRFLLIVFVVFIHANLTPDDALNYYHYDFIQPKWIEVFKNFICSTLGGAAVPLFFLFASYLQFSKNDSYPTLLKKRSKSLLLPYILWTVITVILYFIAQSIPQTAPYFQNPINIVRNWKVLDWIKIFTYHNLGEGLQTPLVYQFWFIRDLIILIVLSPVLKFLCRRLPGWTLIFVSVLALKGIPVFFVNTNALFFYTAGYYFATYKISFFKIADKIKTYEYTVLLALTILFDLLLEGKYNFSFVKTILSCLFFLKLSAIFIKHQNLYGKLEYLAGYSFFLYAVHTPFLGTSINKVTQRIIPLHGILCLFQFLLAALLTILFGTIFGILLNKICSPIFRILNGGRK